ncbi:hypothetical protein G3576_00285 [Roseomonas stagni]|uniref:Uncharacterized protein n=1 Tax=Falsiroseomonas algicola TaxID=2716930 RepID=A0A6M1LDR9_9PROT|nr:hypothetical protein [Falsiroseomonas algicola]NGM18433.1 hypothetical protein [Falsiroseomonas algicola]
MFTTRLTPTRFLRLSLLADAAASGATGLLLAGGADWLAGPFGLSAALLRGVGLFFLPWAALVAWLGLAAAPPRNAVRLVVALNLAWVAESALGLALLGATALGNGFIAFQAVAVLALALAQAAALRQAPLRAALA